MLPQVMQRMSLNAGLVQADTMPVPGTGVAEVELEAFHRYYRKCFGVEVATPPVTPDVTPEMNRLELMRALGLKDQRHFRQQNQQAALNQGWMEMTVSEKPSSHLQRHRLTDAGRRWQARQL